MIPKLHYISQARNTIDQLQNIQKACSSGAELILLDLEHIDVKDHLNLAEEVIKITTHFQTRLVIKAFYKIAHQIKADGVFLDANDTRPSTAREHLYSWQSIGAAAHNLEDCENLLLEDVDYITLGPFKTDTDSSLKPLGLNGYTAIVEALETQTPLIAYGSITVEDVKDILDTGISGIAVSQSINVDFNSIKKFNQLLGASSIDEMRHTFK